MSERPTVMDESREKFRPALEIEEPEPAPITKRKTPMLNAPAPVAKSPLVQATIGAVVVVALIIGISRLFSAVPSPTFQG